MSRDITVALEGATYRGSVAVLRGTEVVAERTLDDADEKPGKSQGDRMMPAVADAMKHSGVKPSDVARVVCGAGPGSFTSLRVAGSIAKGLASGYGVDLYAVSSLLLTVAGATRRLAPGQYVSLLNAMRGEYFALRVTVEADGEISLVDGDAVVLLANEDILKLADGDPAVRCIGPGQPIDETPHARGVARLLDRILKAGPVDLASWEPDYGRLAEAQVRWEAAHGRPLSA